MHEIKTAGQRSDGDVRAGSLGLVTGLLTVFLLGGVGYLGRSVGGPLGPESGQSIGADSKDCGSLGLVRVNPDSCRPRERIDFYIIEDHSTSMLNQRYRAVAEAVESYFVQEKDQISCLGFADEVQPATLAPARDHRSGCTERRNQLDEIRNEEPAAFNRTDFVELFEAIRSRLEQERAGNRGDARAATRNGIESQAYQPHKDLILIISDGIHDPNNAPFDCRRMGVPPLPQSVHQAVKNLGESLKSHTEEAWIYLILAGQQPGCSADLEQRWSELSSDGLNVLTLAPDMDASVIARSIFESMSYSSLALEPDETVSIQDQRKSLDRQGWFEIRYRIERATPSSDGNSVAGDRRQRPIVGTHIPIRDAFLEPVTESPSPWSILEEEPRDTRGSTRGHHLYLGVRSKDPEHGEAVHVDTSNNSMELAFISHQVDKPLDPTSDYRLRLEFEGNVSAAPLLMPRLWTTKLGVWLERLQNVLAVVLVVSILILGIWFLLFTKRAPDSPLTSSESRFVDRSRGAMSFICFVVTFLFVVSCSILIVRPTLGLEWRMLPTAISLLSALYLHPKTNLLIELWATVAIALKIAPSTDV